MSKKINVTVAGPSFSGKTALCNALDNRHVDTSAEYTQTIGVDLITSFVKTKNRNTGNKIWFWDTGDSQKFRTFLSYYINKSSVVVLCFAVNDKISFSLMMDTYNFFKKKIDKKQLIVVSTKHDLKPHLHKINEEMTEKILELGGTYIPSSSSSRQGLDDIIDTIINPPEPKETTSLLKPIEELVEEKNVSPIYTWRCNIL